MNTRADTPTPEDDVKQLRDALALGPTPGPWFASDWSDDFGSANVTVEARSPEILSPGQSGIWPNRVCKHRIAETNDGENPLADAAYIAAANPARIARLLDHIEAQAVRLEAAERDAARYAWLKHGDNDELVLCRGPVDMNYWYLPRNAKLDEAIDIQMGHQSDAAIASEAKP